MTGKEWLKQLLVDKLNECTRLEEEACDRRDWKAADVYTLAWFKLTNQILLLSTSR